MTDEEEKQFDERFTASRNGDWVSSEDGDIYEGKEVKEFISSLLNQRLQSIKEAVEGMYKGHGIKLPNHPHADDLDFFNYTPTGLYNKALEDVLALIKQHERSN